ncbi:hypothetical protein DRE_01069 [Drechslerella stenobrocha 248]|uniref:Amidohydrolase-related domain-containing protein n=1 Tax=Drechslerella stenobrocha 248 TaxID=1043628 RepID=W7HWF0_9PEZI|nr:hypothetical protein DRE_01069 [Drechslerella stenobrocha 248]
MPPISPLIDSHIHLFRPRDLPTLAWQTPQGPLHAAHDLSDYISAISPIPASFAGFIFVETDRKYTDPKDTSGADDLSAWEHVLEEYRYVLQLSKHADEGHRGLVRGIVPWAPLHLGRAAMQRYQKLLDSVDREVYGGEQHGLLVGYRYLLQDKPRGTVTAPEFIEGLEFVRDTGRVFDLGVDVNSGGLWQLDEAVQALKRVDGLKVVVNHLSKPPLGRVPEEGGMEKWEELMRETSGLKNVVVKLSGGFAELPEGVAKPVNGQLPEDEVVDIVFQYVLPIFKLFGPRRVVWASDWPVCGIRYGEIMGQQKGAWQDWLSISRKIVGKLLDEGGIDSELEDWEGIWGQNAVRAYSLPEVAVK